jgi:hypothetical protein
MKLSSFFAQLGNRKRDSEDDEPARFAAPANRVIARNASNPHPYHAVAINPGLMCCPQAKKARGVRFLSRLAPSIPLPGCTMSKDCSCRFQKHNDRRSGDRRLFGASQDDRYFAGQERRRAAGRRATDPRPQAS